MNPTLIAGSLVIALCCMAWGIRRRWLLLRGALGSPRPIEACLDQPRGRLLRMLVRVLGHARLYRYPLTGLAHHLLFFGFLVLGIRSFILIGRGFDPGFNGWFLGAGTWAGDTYGWFKDGFVALVLVGTSLLGYQRLVRRPSRLTHSLEGIAILATIATMMIAEIAYDGALLYLSRHADAEGILTAPFPTLDRATGVGGPPIASFVAGLFEHLGARQVAIEQIAQVGYWTHVALILSLLAWIPHSKHLHILAAPINIYLAPLKPAGSLPLVAATADGLVQRVEDALDDTAGQHPPIGIGKLEDLEWKERLDLLACTECGRCTARCPAALSGAPLSPKELIVGLRDTLYGRRHGQLPGGAYDEPGPNMHNPCGELVAPRSPTRGVDGNVSVFDLVSPEAVWSCTTCRACEEECPVGVAHVAILVRMRRHLVMVEGEPAPGLSRSFAWTETNGNPWNLSPYDRLSWANGLDIPVMNEDSQVDVLLWVGCAPAYDDRARRIARATVKLLTQAGVRFAVLGEAERCTGDAARRAGNELLFLELAAANIKTLSEHQRRGRFKRIVTLCPHCYGTLARDYAELGGQFVVLPHASLLVELLSEGRLQPKLPAVRRYAFHDPCSLTREAGLGGAPRGVLKRLPGAELTASADYSGKRALCCGAGGAQFWMEGSRRATSIQKLRATQLAALEGATVVTACPFCLVMLSDGMEGIGRRDVPVRDVAEVLLDSCSS